MESVMQLTERKPLYYEARAYCEEHNLSMEELEKVRCSMAVRELRKRMEPFLGMLARYHPVMYSGPMTPEYIQLRVQVEEIQQREMESLGLSAATPADTSGSRKSGPQPLLP